MMKKSMRILAVVLAAVLLLSGTAFAADENPTVTPTPADGSAAFQAGYEKLDVTYNDERIVAGGLYMIFVVTADEDGNYIPTESSVLYINQAVATADGTVTFNGIYPSEIADSAIMISGTGLNGPVTVATIEVPAPAYTLGDVNNDGEVALQDAILVLRHIAEIEMLSETELLAADVDGIAGIGISDAVLILQVVAGLISEI